MDSAVGEDPTLPLDFNGSSNLSRLPGVAGAGDMSDHFVISDFTGERMSPIRAHTMKDFENQITELKKENFNLKLRIYFLEERMQQKYDDASEDIFKTNIELKVEIESLKHELQEKQGLLIKASKAVESLAGNNTAEIQRVKQEAQQEIQQIKKLLGDKIHCLEEDVKSAQAQCETIAAIAEQEKVRNMDLEQKLVACNKPNQKELTFPPEFTKRWEEQSRVIEQLNLVLKSKETLIDQLQQGKAHGASNSKWPLEEKIEEMTKALGVKENEAEVLRKELESEKRRFDKELQNLKETQSQVARLEVETKQLSEELENAKREFDTIQEKLQQADVMNKGLQGKLKESECELATEKQNGLKRDKTIQGLTLALKSKDKEIEDLFHEIEDRDCALAKAREAIHKAQINKFQGVEEHTSLLMEKESELAELRAEHSAKLRENQKLQRALGRKDQEFNDLQQEKEQLEKEMDEVQQQKSSGDKAINDLRNQLEKLRGDLLEKECALEHHYHTLLSESKQKLQSQELTIRRLTNSLNEKDQLLQEYMELAKEAQQGEGQSSDRKDAMLANLRECLKEKDRELEQAINEKFSAVDKIENEVRQLRLALREKEREVERLNNLLSSNEETINELEGSVKEKDTELHQLLNTCKNLQRVKQELEESKALLLHEKDGVVSQLHEALANKSKDLEEIRSILLSQKQSDIKDVAEQLHQQLKLKERLLEEAWAEKERLHTEHEKEVEELFKTIQRKDQFLKAMEERLNKKIEDLKRQLSAKEDELTKGRESVTALREEHGLSIVQLKALLEEKDKMIKMLIESGQEKDQCFAKLKDQGFVSPQVVELKQTIKILQEQLEGREAEENQQRTVDEEIVVKTMPSSKSLVNLKKELAQRTEELNKALKKESEMGIEVMRLKSLLSRLEEELQAQAAHIESLSKTLQVKDEIIQDLQATLRKYLDGREMECLIQNLRENLQSPTVPKRKHTVIGGDCKKPTLPSDEEKVLEYEELKRALKAEQQLYSSLIRAVKDPDSMNCLQNLQMELTAVQLLRQQLEEEIRANQGLRKDLEETIEMAKKKEDHGLDTDLSEVETLRYQLEETQRWNASLQARLGQIQARCGGVGAANETSDTLSFIGDQTSYMSICLRDQDDFEQEIAKLNLLELRQKVTELIALVKELQASNQALQNKAALAEGSILGFEEHEKQDSMTLTSHNKLHDTKQDDVTVKNDFEEVNSSIGSLQPKTKNQMEDEENDKQSLSYPKKEQPSDQKNQQPCKPVTPHSSSDQQSADECLPLPNQPESEIDPSSQQSGVKNELKNTEKFPSETVVDQQKIEEGILLKSLMEETGMSSVLELRNELLQLQAKVGVLHREQVDTLGKESSEDEREGKDEMDLKQMVIRLRVKLRNSRMINKLLKQQVELNSSVDGESTFNPDLIVKMAKEIERLKEELNVASEKVVDMERKIKEAEDKVEENTAIRKASIPRSTELRSRAGMRSRLPVPTRKTRSVGNMRSVPSAQNSDTDFQEQIRQLRRTLKDYKFQNELLQRKLCAAEVTVASQQENVDKCRAQLQADSSLEQDDKEVQVDLQDLGYETCGKSENEVDRDESSSPDNVSHLSHHHVSDSNIPSTLHKLGQHFFSMENLATNSSTSYPSSASLVSSKISLKNLEIFDDCELTDDPRELKQQITELRIQIEKYQKELQHLQKKNSLSGDHLDLSFDQFQQSMAKVSSEEQVLDTNQKEDIDDKHSSYASSMLVTNCQGKERFPLRSSSSQTVDLEDQGKRNVHSSALSKQERQELERLKQQILQLEPELEKERAKNKKLLDQLNHLQTKLKAASPTKYDSLVQSQARELSHFRQQIKESRSLCILHRKHLQEVTKAFEELLQASDVDYYVGESFREQLDQSVQLLEKLESKLDNGDVSSDSEDGELFELAQNPRNLQHEIIYLRKHLESERRQLHKQLNDLLQQNQNLSHSTKEQLDQLTKELQEKNKTIHHLQQQLRNQSLAPSICHTSYESEASDRYSLESPEAEQDKQEEGHGGWRDFQRNSSADFEKEQTTALCSPRHLEVALDQPNGSHVDETEPGIIIPSSGKLPLPENESETRQEPPEVLHTNKKLNEANNATPFVLNQSTAELQRENSALREQLKISEQLNETLRVELNLHQSIMTEGQEGCVDRSTLSPDRHDSSCSRNREHGIATERSNESKGINTDFLAEHLQEIRILRQRLEDSIRTNDRLRKQLEQRLSESERDLASTNIFIHGSEEHTHRNTEIHFLREQNQDLKEQLTRSSRDKQKENEKLKESLAKKCCTVERLRIECEHNKRENGHLQKKVGDGQEENRRLKNELHYSRDEINRLQRELSLQQQELTESQQLLQSLRLELKVYEQLNETSARKSGPTKEPTLKISTGLQSPVDMSELVAEIRSLRVQLERSIQTNNALRQKLEEQLLKARDKLDGATSTININYLLTGEQRRSTGRNSNDVTGAELPAQDSNSFQQYSFPTPPKSGNSPPIISAAGGLISSFSGIASLPKEDTDSASDCSSSTADSASHTPSRLVPGHRMWADRNGHHVLGLIEDYNALRKQISEGRILVRGMEASLRDYLNVNTGSQVPEQSSLKKFFSSVNTMQQMLEEVSRLLKLLWKVSLPSVVCSDTTQHNQDEITKNELARLQKKISEQEKLLHGTVKRLRTTNQLKEGMEKIIIDQLKITHSVLKKARGNLETNHFMVFGLKGIQTPGKDSARDNLRKWELVHKTEVPTFESVSVQEICPSSEEANSSNVSFCSY
ncbi:CDK5 regulatory subunit-associated protein 2 isoform X3 [Latimeria chalumnae]|uniref:CDK5 regulatory subunit-associated protein 2 isoform X3 n=1 Tax=Latimeria chalumnae TaxID=7897 RepID=UPI00313D4D08